MEGVVMQEDGGFVVGSWKIRFWVCLVLILGFMCITK